MYASIEYMRVIHCEWVHWQVKCQLNEWSRRNARYLLCSQARQGGPGGRGGPRGPRGPMGGGERRPPGGGFGPKDETTFIVPADKTGLVIGKSKSACCIV